MRRHILGSVLLFAAPGLGCGSSPLCGSEPLSTSQRACVFNAVWNAAAQNYPFFALKGIDWDAGYQQFEPLAMAAADDTSFDLVVAQLVASLQDGHSFLTCPPTTLGPVVYSLTILALDGGYFVASVLPNTDASDAGVSPGDQVLSVDGQSAADRFAQVSTFFGIGRAAAFGPAFARDFLTGGTAPTAQIEILSVDGGEHTVGIARNQPSLKPGSTLPNGIGYIPTFDFYNQSTEAFYAQGVTPNARGLIIDLRGDPGGQLQAVESFADIFFSQPTETVMEINKLGVITDVSFQATNPVYSGPVAFLIDDTSFSGANLIPQLFQFTHRAILVGRTTGGGSGSPIINLQLTPLVSLALSGEYYETADGGVTEVTGVIPDIAVTITAADLQAGRMSAPGDPANDLDMEAAVQALLDAGA
jgi:carboxyl-terminal processing protease